MNYNTKISIKPGLQDTYQVFNLDASKVDANIKIEVIIDGDQYIENGTPQIMHAGNSSYKLFEGINNENSNTWSLDNYGKKFKSLLVRYFSNYADTIKKSTGSDIYEEASAYKNYKNQFTIIFKDKADKNIHINGQYIGYMQNAVDADKKSCISKLLSSVNGSSSDNYIFINTNIIHYSKYYNIYKSSDISVPVLQPVLYTKEDLEKLNMTISDNNVFINSLSKFTAWNDGDGDNRDKRREYRYECNLENGKFSINNQFEKKFNHNANVEWDYSQFKQHSYGKYFVTDIANVSNTPNIEEMYNDYFPKGFMLFTLSGERPYIGINTNNVKSYEHFKKQVLYTWRKWFVSKNDTYYIGYHGLADGNDENVLAGLYYRGDKEDNVHLLNCWFTLQANNNNGRIITQKIAYNKDYQNKKPEYIGTCIASIFANIYHYVKDSDVPITQIVDTIYLSEHDTTYTKDIIYRESVIDTIENPNTLLVFKGIKYGSYVELVKQMAGVNNDSPYSGDKNVNAVIHSCVKNVPLQYKLTYKEPDTDLVNANNDFYLLKTIDNPLGTRIYGKLSTDKLYQLDYSTDGKPMVNNLTTTFKIKYLESIELNQDTGIISGKFSKKFEQDNNPDICSTWNINNDLTLSNYKYGYISNRYYSMLTTKEENVILFADYDKKETLLPFAKFVS